MPGSPSRIGTYSASVEGVERAAAAGDPQAVTPDSPHYTLARRLVKFLNYIQTADVEDEIPVNSILREFIGGCCFYKDED